MYLMSLKNINQNPPIMQQEILSNETLKKFDDLLVSISPYDSLSPQYIAHELDIYLDTVNKFLVKLADLNILEVHFILKCANEEFSDVDEFMFTSFEDLIEFVNQNETCPECHSDLLEENTRVLFIKPGISHKEVF